MANNLVLYFMNSAPLNCSDNHDGNGRGNSQIEEII